MEKKLKHQWYYRFHNEAYCRRCGVSKKGKNIPPCKYPAWMTEG